MKLKDLRDVFRGDYRLTIRRGRFYWELTEGEDGYNLYDVETFPFDTVEEAIVKEIWPDCYGNTRIVLDL